MATTDFDLRTLFSQAFGYEAPRQQISIPQAPARMEQSQLGQPYYMEDMLGREFFMPVTLDGYLIPFAVMSMTWKKTYVKTAMPERGGSVKELISLDDYVFSVKGIFLSQENAFPEQPIIDLHNIFKKNTSITMRSVLSAIVLKGNFEEKVIISDVKFPEMAGIEHAQAFDMTLESDMIFELEID